MRLRERFAHAARGALGLIFHEACAGCGAAGSGPLCAACMGDVRLRPRNLCAVCARPLDFDYAIETGAEYECGACRADPPPYDAACWALYYEGTARELVHAFKFAGRRGLAEPLARLAGEVLEPWLLARPGAVIVPAPLSWRRLYARGYNHAYLLARALARRTGHEVIEDAVRRVRHTPPQFGLNIKERAANVKGAFRVVKPAALEGRDVIVFDDILTTGATVTELAKMISKVKPASVAVAAALRAGED